MGGDANVSDHSIPDLKSKREIFEQIMYYSSIRDTFPQKLLSGELPIAKPEQFTGGS
jgi:hypothetical protein